MSASGDPLPVPVDALRALDLAKALEGIDRSHFWPVHEALSKLRSELDEAENHYAAIAAELLAAVCSFHFQTTQGENPWGPFWRSGSSRGIQADDLIEDHLASLGEFVFEIEDSELQGRVADVLWECKQGFKFARLAIEAYCRSLKPVDQIAANHFAWKISRAATLAAKLERDRPLHLGVIAQVEVLISEFENELSMSNLLSDLGRLLLSHQKGDPTRYACLFERLAVDALRVREWHFAISHWEQAEDWHRRNKDSSEESRCNRMVGEVMIQRGQDEEDRKRLGNGYSAAWLMRGIEILRTNRVDSERIKILHAELIEVQRLQLSDLNAVSFDPSEIEGYDEGRDKCVERVQQLFTAISLDEAISKLASLTKPTDTKNLRKQVQDAGREHIYQIVGVETLDFEGKKAGKIGPSSATGETPEVDLLGRMFDWASKSVWPMACDWLIEPARQVIASEHRLRAHSLAFLVYPNPFIPAGHEGIYLRGVIAGFNGDFLVSSHLLVPQLEQSIRMVFKSRGAITSTLKSGLQREMDLGGLLTHELAVSIFGEDTVFDLRGILIEKFGENLRNNMAHGFLSENSFNGAGACYLWWLTVRLLWIGCRIAHDE